MRSRLMRAEHIPPLALSEDELHWFEAGLCQTKTLNCEEIKAIYGLPSEIIEQLPVAEEVE